MNLDGFALSNIPFFFYAALGSADKPVSLVSGIGGLAETPLEIAGHSQKFSLSPLTNPMALAVRHSREGLQGQLLHFVCPGSRRESPRVPCPEQIRCRFPASSELTRQPAFALQDGLRGMRQEPNSRDENERGGHGQTQPCGACRRQRLWLHCARLRRLETVCIHIQTLP